jgi:hypothetical protein
MTDEMEPLGVEARLIADLGVQVARLTHQVAFRDMIIKELKHEIKTERAAVVAWLRNEVGSAILYRADDVSMDSASAGVAMLLAHVANAIERGEHRREEEP